MRRVERGDDEGPQPLGFDLAPEHAARLALVRQVRDEYARNGREPGVQNKRLKALDKVLPPVPCRRTRQRLAKEGGAS